MLIAPLVVLTGVASYISGNGLAGWWFLPYPLEYTVAAAMHASYALRSPKTSRLLTVLA